MNLYRSLVNLAAKAVYNFVKRESSGAPNIAELKKYLKDHGWKPAHLAKMNEKATRREQIEELKAIIRREK